MTKLELLPDDFTVCRVTDTADIDLKNGFCFAAVTDEELSVVCPTRHAPAAAPAREDGWRGFRIAGVLDFSLVGVLSRLTGVLAEAGVGIFAVSTFNTDYIFVKEKDLGRAKAALSAAGYEFS